MRQTSIVMMILLAKLYMMKNIWRNASINRSLLVVLKEKKNMNGTNTMLKMMKMMMMMIP